MHPPCARSEPRAAPRQADAQEYPSTCPVSFCCPPQTAPALTATIPARPGGHSVPTAPGAALAPDHAALTVQGAVRAGVPMLRGCHTGPPAELRLPGRGRGGSAGVWGVPEGGCGALISSAPGSCGEFQEPRWARCPVPKFLCCRHPAGAGPVPGGSVMPLHADTHTCPCLNTPAGRCGRAATDLAPGAFCPSMNEATALRSPEGPERT